MSERRVVFFAALTFAALGFTPPTARAQQVPTTTLVGFVIDASSGEPVPAALVSLSPLGRQAIADSLGIYRFSDVPIGVHTVVVQRIGYLRLSLAIQVNPLPAPLELSLSPDPVALQGLTVTGGMPVTLGGSVKDARTGEPLPFAALWLTPDAVKSTAEGFAREDGTFGFDAVPSGTYLLGARLVGYGTQYTPVLAAPSGEPIEVYLEPDSLVLAGLPLLSRELHTRRNADLRIAVPFSAGQLIRSEARHALDFLTKETWINPHPCERGPGLCVLYGGRLTRPTVYIDDRRLCGGDELSYLAAFHPGEFYLVEVFGGAEVRAYTHDFVERQASRQATKPHALAPTLECDFRK